MRGPPDHYEDDWSRLAWVRAVGAVPVRDADRGDEEVRAALAALAAKYDAYAADPPDGPLLGLRPERLLCWRASEPA